jgi:hypothetical protein
MIDMSNVEIEHEVEAFPKFIGVSTEPDGSRVFDLWAPTSSGHITIDLALGAYYADLAVEIARLQGSDDFIFNVLTALVAKKTMQHIEAGFLRGISQRAYVGAHN